jgi:hypothetical protein
VEFSEQRADLVGKVIEHLMVLVREMLEVL